MRQDPDGYQSHISGEWPVDTHSSDIIALLPISVTSEKGPGTDIIAAATRLIRSGSFYLNDIKVNDPRHELHRQDLVEGKVAMIKMGNRNHLVLSIQEDGA